MTAIRTPAVAGSFYPAEPQQLAGDIRRMLAAVPPPDPAATTSAVVKAIVAPHAGYIYSGPIAASVYARLAEVRRDISRVVLLGPSHRVAFRGIAASSADAFQTPLGRIPVDRQAVERLLAVPGVGTLDAAHDREHSLEVHLPFLQMVLDRFQLVPLVVGDAPDSLVAAVIDAAWAGRETLLVVSSDLSHYHDYRSARSIDHATCDAILRLDTTAITHDQACGRTPLAGLLTVAQRRGLGVETIDLRNSGDTAGPRDRVVGYGAWAFTEPAGGPGALADPAAQSAAAAPAPTAADKAAVGKALLAIARAAIAARLEGRAAAAAPASVPEAAADTLYAEGASFVTLSRKGNLRGCIGSPTAWRPLAVDVADNAVRAAFQDPRFPPMSPAEWPDVKLSVSLLSPPQTMSFSDEPDLLAQLRPGIDGLIIEDQGRRALFLPAVWAQLPDRRSFLAHLKSKAGLLVDHWSPSFRALRFTNTAFTEEEFGEQEIS
jgi:hypothetical protein